MYSVYRGDSSPCIAARTTVMERGPFIREAAKF